jgi:hypothetical protein
MCGDEDERGVLVMTKRRKQPHLGKSFTVEIIELDLEAAIRAGRGGLAIERALKRAFPGATNIRSVDYGTDAHGFWYWRSGAGMWGPFPTKEAAEQLELELAEGRPS